MRLELEIRGEISIVPVDPGVTLSTLNPTTIYQELPGDNTNVSVAGSSNQVQKIPLSEPIPTTLSPFSENIVFLLCDTASVNPGKRSTF